MFYRVAFALTVILGLTLNVQAHAIISPALGVKGAPVRDDVQKPSTQSPCGNVNIANTIGTTQPIIAQAQGTFVANITNFNTGEDGSRSVTAEVDADGTGKKFVQATVTKNGDLAPTNVGSQQLSVQLPTGTKCTGGPDKNSCLVSFKTAGNFGNCVVVQQSGAASSSSKKTRAWGSRVARAVVLAEDVE